MPTAQEKRLARSKSCGGRPERELRSASTHANAPLLNQRKGRSPARGGRLPEKNVNKEAMESPQRVHVSSDTSTEFNSKATDTEMSSVSAPAQPDDPQISNLSDGGSGPPRQVSDNRGSGPTSPIMTITTSPSNEDFLDQLQQAKEDPAKALLMVLAELKDIKSQMIEMRKTETVTASLVEQLAENKNKVRDLEVQISKDESKVQNLKEDFSTLENKMAQQTTNFSELESKVSKMGDELEPMKTKLEQQEKEVHGLRSFKEEVTGSSERAIECMNNLVDTQRDQVDTFNAGVKRIGNEWKNEVLIEVEKRLKKMEKEKQGNKEVMKEVDKRFQKMENDRYCNSLKDQAYRNRFNLVVMGLTEEEDKSTIQIVQKFFTDTLKAKNMDVNSAARLGSQPITGSDNARPILVKFNKLAQRNRIWRKRRNIPVDGTNSRVRIQADLPKTLREGVQSLYRVVAAATKMEQFQDMKVQDFQLEWRGKTYQITDLETLPKPIRPSTLASPKSDTHMVFFSKHSQLSNHFPAKFSIKEHTYDSMEHFLAVKRAELSGRQDLIERALKVKDAAQAKYILNALHGDHQEQWDDQIEQLANEGLRAKFTQNTQLKDFLCSTDNLILGEASTNIRWGIGMDLQNPEVLNPVKWSDTGNLLGRSLMRLRQELNPKKTPSTNKAPKPQSKGPNKGNHSRNP